MIQWSEGQAVWRELEAGRGRGAAGFTTERRRKRGRGKREKQEGREPVGRRRKSGPKWKHAWCWRHPLSRSSEVCIYIFEKWARSNVMLIYSFSINTISEIFFARVTIFVLVILALVSIGSPHHSKCTFSMWRPYSWIGKKAEAWWWTK